MARKLPVLQRVLGPETVAGIVYGEISSSLYFALGIVALWALGLTPIVLVVAGVLFSLAASAYAEAATTFGDPGGAAGIARRAFGDLVGFAVGWAVLLDFAVVIGLSLLFVPHYAVATVGHVGAVTHPADELIAVGLALVVAAATAYGRPKLASLAVRAAALDIVVQVVLGLLGLAVVFDADKLTRPIHLGTTPTWSALTFALPIAMLAFTGIEIVANLLRESENPGRFVARETLGAIVATTVVYAVMSIAALSAFPVEPAPGTPSGHASAISTVWLAAPLAGLAQAVGDQLGAGAGATLRAVVGLSAVLILLFNALSAFVGATRLVGALGGMKALPERLLQPSRRLPVSLGAIALVFVSVPLVLAVASLFDDDASGLAAIYSFGILIAFMAVFLGIIVLRFREPTVTRPIRMPLGVEFGRARLPLTALVGFGLSWVTWLLALGTHRAARTVAPLWLLGGLVVFVLVRRRRGLTLVGAPREAVAPPEVAEVPYGTILVPMKQAGPIEDEMLAAAAKLARAEEGARVLALHVTEVPLAQELDVPIPGLEEEVERSAARVAQFRADYGVDMEFLHIRARAISGAIAEEARRADAGLILIGAVPRFGRRAGRHEVFSDTIENLLRRADCRVIVTAFPPGTASVAAAEEPAAASAAHAH
jgi:basic amino acid/polyamine antiporter, APA family